MTSMVPEMTPSRRLDWLWELLDLDPPFVADVFVAIGIIVLSWIIGKWIVRVAGRPVARRFSRPSVTRAVLQSIQIFVLLVGLIIAATIVGFSPGEILLSVTVFSAVLAVVLAPIVRRFISGMFVLADQPYEIGDMIELVDTNRRGFVEDVTLRYTKLFTMSNTFLVIPNSEILDRDIVNFSAEDSRTRQELEIVVTYEGDLDRARELIASATAGVDGVIEGGPAIRVGSSRYPAEPRCYIESFGDHGIVLRLLYWVRDPYHLPRTRSRVQEAIWEALPEEPVRIAYPHTHLVFDDTSGRLDIDLNGNDGEN